VAGLADPAASETLSERDQTALLFAELLITSPAGLTDALWDEMRRFFTDAQIVELCFFVLTYNTAQRFNTAIDLDPRDGTNLVVQHMRGDRLAADDD
jgi:alkylhydroperoxidase family enzyme